MSSRVYVYTHVSWQSNEGGLCFFGLFWWYASAVLGLIQEKLDLIFKVEVWQ